MKIEASETRMAWEGPSDLAANRVIPGPKKIYADRILDEIRFDWESPKPGPTPVRNTIFATQGGK